MFLDIHQILRILPHRAPFLLIDRVIDLQPRKSAKAIKCVSYNEPIFAGHFPGQPIFPAVFVIEAMAQLMCVLAYASDAINPDKHVFGFAGIDKAKFRHPVRPGDQLRVEVEVIQQRANIWKCGCSAWVDEVLCGEAEILAAIQDRDSA